jgi:hypothetical protein
LNVNYNRPAAGNLAAAADKQVRLVQARGTGRLAEDGLVDVVIAPVPWKTAFDPLGLGRTGSGANDCTEGVPIDCEVDVDLVAAIANRELQRGHDILVLAARRRSELTLGASSLARTGS